MRRRGSVVSAKTRLSRPISIRTKCFGIVVASRIVCKRLKIVAPRCMSVVILVKAIGKRLNVYLVLRLIVSKLIIKAKKDKSNC